MLHQKNPFVPFLSDNKNNSCTILHQNIAGYLNKQNLFEMYLNELNDSSVSVDVICLSETFIKTGSESNAKLHNFILSARFSRDAKRGGVCIFTRANLKTKEVPGIKNFAQVYSFECCAVELIELHCIVLCVYRIPNSNVDIFFEKLDLSKVKKYEKKYCYRW